MATIKAIEAKSVHQIQSGQVIVDLCSVAKELVENSLDAGATSIEVRFRNNGLDAVEVQDNGSGISPANYENIALKHYTSKISTYDDLSSVQTFGFRGEALSSLCALSKFSVTTAQAEDAPKGKRLEFDVSGRLKSTTIVACQKGTTVTVEGLFESLPVRRKELAKNIKREYGKVLGLLHAYACICVNVKFTVKNTMPKAKSMTVFSTKANATTRENIANVYGAKTLAALMPLDLELDFRPTLTQMVQKDNSQAKIRVRGHISKPVFGEGRQTPDRQMFFVNGRPCGLPQIAKAINEVYKAFNVSQSPFIFADLQMDTNSYDVNVSPDKRTILLHDSAVLIENLKAALNERFEKQDHTVPQSQLQTPKLPAFQKLNFQRSTPDISTDAGTPQSASSIHSMRQEDSWSPDEVDSTTEDIPNGLFKDHFRSFTTTRDESEMEDRRQAKAEELRGKRAENLAQRLNEQAQKTGDRDETDHVRELAASGGAEPQVVDERPQSDPDDNDPRDASSTMVEAHESVHVSTSHVDGRDSPEIPSTMPSTSQEEPGVVPNAFDRMRPRRMPAELATVQIGDKTVTTVLGTQLQSGPDPRRHQTNKRRRGPVGRHYPNSTPVSLFSQKLRKFGAEGIDLSDDEEVAEHSDTPSSVQSDRVTNEELSRQESDNSQHEASSEGESEHLDDAHIPTNLTEDESDTDYIDEAEKKRLEESRVAELIRVAEEKSAIPSKENLKRATKALAGVPTKDATTALLAKVDFSVAAIEQQMRTCFDHAQRDLTEQAAPSKDDTATAQDPETQLSLTVSKADFAEMIIVGQFNLGFILAVRPAKGSSDDEKSRRQDELFIIDQHASDEKYNFERLQLETVVGNQRLVRPVILDLTAVEEEIVLENQEALEKNGFLVEIDMSGESMVGQRCRLVSLPLSKEVVFNTQDLEELIHLLAEAPGAASGNGAGVPRPSKVRKMFAMRACRSSIMIGKTLSNKQMEKVVMHMGTIDKPWNCPHGRPTMRHVCSLNAVESWREGDEGPGKDQLGLGKALHSYIAEEEEV